MHKQVLYDKTCKLINVATEWLNLYTTAELLFVHKPSSPA